MRRIKVKLSPSLEQDDITTRLEEALKEEKEKTTEVDAELNTPLDNKQGFDEEVSKEIQEETEAVETGEEQVLESVTNEETTEVTDEVIETDPTTEVTEVADTETPMEAPQDTETEEVVSETTEEVSTDVTEPTGGEVSDVIAETVVDASTGDTGSSAVNEFVTKIKDSFDLAVEKGFTGTFNDFLTNLTETITSKETEIVSTPNALGTTDGSGDLVEPESTASELDQAASAEVTDEVTEPETTLDESTGSEETIEATDEVIEGETVEDTTTEITDEVTETTEVTDETGSDDSTVVDNTTSETEVEGTEETTESTDEETTDATLDESADTTGDTSEEGSVEPETTDTESTDDLTTSEDTNLNGEETDLSEEETKKAPEVEDPENTDDESLNEYIEEVQETEKGESDVDEMVEEAVDTSTRLGRIAELVKEAVDEAKEGDEEDVNESLAKIAQIATECLAEKVGIEKESRFSISNESFEDSSSVLYSYQISLEDIKATMKKIVDAILKAIEAASRWIEEQYRNIQLSFGITEKKIKALKEKLKKVKGSADNKNNKNIKNAALADVLRKGSSVSSTPSQDIEQVSKIGSAVYKNMTDWVLDSVKASIAKSDAASKHGRIEVYGFTNQDYRGQELTAVSNPVQEGFITEEEKTDLRVAKGPELLGSKTLVLFAPIEDEDEFNQITPHQNSTARVLRSGKFGVRLMDFLPNEKDIVNENLSVLTIKEMEETLNSLEGLLKVILEYKQVKPKVDKVRSDVQRYVRKLRFIQNISFDNDGKIGTLAGLYKTVVKTIDDPAISFTKYSIKIINASLQYVNLSMKEYQLEETRATNQSTRSDLVAA